MRSLSLALVFAAVSSLATFGCAAGVDSDLPSGGPTAQAPSAGCEKLEGRCIGEAARVESNGTDNIAHAAVSNGVSPEAARKLPVRDGYQVENPAPRDWKGHWQKGNSDASVASAHFVTEGQQITGRLVFTGSSCFAGTMQVKAMRDGSGLIGTASVDDTVSEIAAIGGEKSLVNSTFFIDGKYTVIAGACAGDRGTFAMER